MKNLAARRKTFPKAGHLCTKHLDWASIKDLKHLKELATISYALRNLNNNILDFYLRTYSLNGDTRVVRSAPGFSPGDLHTLP